jgi:C1A family cysteine protease
VVALTAALSAACAAYLEYRQTEYRLIHYNQTVSSLISAKHLWMGLPKDKHTANFDQFVKTIESILETENMGWVQKMKDALAALHASQEKNAGNQN